MQVRLHSHVFGWFAAPFLKSWHSVWTGRPFAVGLCRVMRRTSTCLENQSGKVECWRKMVRSMWLGRFWTDGTLCSLLHLVLFYIYFVLGKYHAFLRLLNIFQFPKHNFDSGSCNLIWPVSLVPVLQWENKMPTILLSPSFCSEVRVLLYLQTLPCIFHASFICIFVSSLSSALGPQHDIELLLLYSVVARFSTSILVWVELRRSQTAHQRFFELHLKVLTWWVDLWWVTSNGILDQRPNPNAKWTISNFHPFPLWSLNQFLYVFVTWH